MYEDLRAVQSVQYLQSRHDSIEQIRNRQMGKSDDRLTQTQTQMSLVQI